MAQDSPEHRFVMILCRFGVPFWRSKMLQKSIPKSRQFQAGQGVEARLLEQNRIMKCSEPFLARIIRTRKDSGNLKLYTSIENAKNTATS